jgi:hypothetical protein
MFGLGQLFSEDLKTRVSSWLELGAPDQPSRDEIRAAYLNARYIKWLLNEVRKGVRYRHPHRTDVLALVRSFEQVLRSEHGGELPETLFEDWEEKRGYSRDDRVHFTPGQRETMSIILQRWKDWATVSKEFEPLLDGVGFKANLRLKTLEKKAKFMREWIRSHQSCPAY